LDLTWSLVFNVNRMRKNTYKIIAITALLAFVLPSCKKGFNDINTSPNDTPNALPQQLLAPALVNTVSYNMFRNRNFTNELMQVTVDASDAEGKVFRYDIKRTWGDYLWNGWYTQLTNFKDIYTIAGQPLTSSKTYMGISLICQSWIYSMLTDTYGDVPYSESNKGKDDNNFTPVFDKQKDIYLDLFKKLEEANALLNGAGNVLGGSDPVYAGNALKWRKFGNTLYLRLLLRLSGKSEVAASCIDKIKEIVDTKASSYPIMAGNEDSAILRWTGVAPYTSPFIGGVREQDFRTPGMASFFIDHLVVWNDPRINIPTYGTNGVNRFAIVPYQGAYLGVPSGYAPGENPVKKSYFYSTGQTVNSLPAATLQSDPLTGMIMNYAELQFILAEAAAKGWINGSAAAYYTNGAKSSITLWLPTWAEDINTFLAAADIEWEETASLDQKMELIHLQKYYALFLTDLQQWFEYRRTGHPVLPKGTGLRNDGVMPARLTYPVYVQSANPTNYKAAVVAMGGDEIFTQVWWQKP
jgi:hypothetical protein